MYIDAKVWMAPSINQLHNYRIQYQLDSDRINFSYLEYLVLIKLRQELSLFLNFVMLFTLSISVEATMKSSNKTTPRLYISLERLMLPDDSCSGAA